MARGHGWSVGRILSLAAFVAAGVGLLTASASAGSLRHNPPSVVVKRANGQSDPARSAPVRFTVTFNGRVTGFTSTDVVIGGTSGGTKAVTVTGSRDGRTFAVSVTGMTGPGTVSVAIPADVATDLAGYGNVASASTDGTITYAAGPAPARPSVTIDQADGQADPTSAQPVRFTARFSAPVVRFAASDVAVGGTAGGSKTVTVTDLGDHRRFDVVVGGVSSGGTVTAAVGAGQVSDATGQGNLASTSRDGSITYADQGSVSRVDLTAKFGSNLAQAMAWLAANPQPAIVKLGVYTTSDVLDIPAGADLVLANVTVLPRNPAASALRLRGLGTKLTFSGVCRIGAAGSTNGRLGNAEAAGIELEGASNFTITADALTIEGVAQDGIFSYRGSHDGVIAGKITALNTGADSFHVTDRSYNLDFKATLLSVGSGDDGFAVVSYLENGTRVRNVHWHDITVRDQRDGRGVSVVGGQDVTVDHFDVDGSAGAGVYVAAEPQYDTYGVDGVTMSGRIRNPNTQHIHDANVVVYSAQQGQTIANVSMTVDADPGWRLVHSTGYYPISKVTVDGVPVP
jgi:hypothetical protein